jgi:hypothetical protein
MIISEIYAKTLDNLKQNLDNQQLDDARKCSSNILALLGNENEDISQKTIFLAYGGGKDSSFVVAFVRLIQLLVLDEKKKTFKLRIATNRHSGVLKPVLKNIDRVYKKLNMYNDPYVELLLVDGNDISSFDMNKPIPEHVLSRNRRDILMTGHLCHGEARPTFCNACNLSMTNSFSMAMGFNGIFVDMILTGDSKGEIIYYYKWVRKVSRALQVEEDRGKNFSNILSALDKISKRYFKTIYGSLALNEESGFYREIGNEPVFYSIYGCTKYEVGAHWEFLVSFLGFEFDELAFNFTETDCFNPALMAHIRGLRSLYLDDQAYEEGLREYINFALNLMKMKQIPESLLDEMRERYSNSENILRVKKRVSEYTQSVLGITDKQLICMVYSPFASKGEFLAKYIEEQYPSQSNNFDILHQILSGQGELNQNNQDVWSWIGEVSGLSLEEARQLYKLKLVKSFSNLSIGNYEDAHPIEVLLSGDPHKATFKIKTPNGRDEERFISGR